MKNFRLLPLFILPFPIPACFVGDPVENFRFCSCLMYTHLKIGSVFATSVWDSFLFFWLVTVCWILLLDFDHFIPFIILNFFIFILMTWVFITTFQTSPNCPWFISCFLYARFCMFCGVGCVPERTLTQPFVFLCLIFAEHKSDCPWKKSCYSLIKLNWSDSLENSFIAFEVQTEAIRFLLTSRVPWISKHGWESRSVWDQV